MAWSHCSALLKTLGRPQDTLQTDWLVHSDALISVCSEVQDEEQLSSVAPAVVPTIVVPAVPAADKKRTASRQLGNEQVTAIHRSRYATSMGLVFKEVSLEEVVEAPGGVEKYSKMTIAEAQTRKEYDDNNQSINQIPFN